MRGKRAYQRDIMPDPRHQSVVLAKFINHIMHDGKKLVAQTIVYDALDIIADKTGDDPLTLFEQALSNVEPRLEVRSRRVGGATYQVPREVQGNRRQFLAMKWIIGAARDGSGQPVAARLAEELLDAANNEGTAVRKKENMHRMADANRAFAHLAW